MIGIAGLILELKMPGIGLPGVIAAVCFVLFFWAHSFVGQFTSETLLSDIEAALARSGMPPDLLELEITESTVMQNVERASRLLHTISPASATRGPSATISAFSFMT